KFVIASAYCDPTHYCELARAADEYGYHAISVSDHVVHPEKISSRYPYTEDGTPRFAADTPWPDPWVAIGAMAAVTRRLRFLTNIFVLPMRNPFLVAKAVGTAAVLSGDRVALGIGVGWMKDEFDLLGQPFAGRGRRAEEMIEVMRKLWTGELVEHRGDCFEFDRLRMVPAPRQPIPIYVGGISEIALRRAARLADGWISELHRTDELAGLIARLRRHRAEAGRGEEPLAVFGSAMDAGSPDGYRRLAEIGVTHVLTQPWVFYGGDRSLEAQRDGLRRFGDDVIARMA
ncbi:MAG: LLM class F420-dependent oxidoreductase, partial [Myxococcota bacterium]